VWRHIHAVPGLTSVVLPSDGRICTDISIRHGRNSRMWMSPDTWTVLNCGFEFCRTSRIGAGTCPAACKSTLRISIGTTQVPGKQLYSESPCACITDELYRILEYVTREEAETALRYLDGRDIRGRPVRVQYAPERVRWLPSSIFVGPDLGSGLLARARIPPTVRRPWILWRRT